MRKRTWGWLALLLLLGACEGTIVEPTSFPGGRGGPGVVQPAPATRFPRLTHLQWENTVRDLLRLPEESGASVTFRADPSTAGFVFDNDGRSLEVDQALFSAYQRAADGIAEEVVADPALLDPLLPPDTGDALGRARLFVTEFGQRVHRHPLTNEEVEEYMVVYARAEGLYAGLDAFHSGVRLLLSAFLQSPMFLYRIEESTQPDGSVIPLDAWETAQRLSYFLWNSMPDDELFEAASSGRILDPTELEREARRMLADPRAEEVVLHFHDQLLEVERFGSVNPSPAFFPDADPRLGEYALTEQHLFLREMIFARDGTWGDVLTDTDTFVNAELARIYGLEGTYGEEFVSASLAPNERRGLFTHVGFLASNATSVHPDPIHRGAFLARRITCTPISAPPDNVPPVPPVEGRTNRETIEQHTEQPGTVCATCHARLINPYGFPYEIYDAVGAYRTEDNGFAVDSRSAPYIGSEASPVDDALGLADALADGPTVHECYAQHWIEFAMGRKAASEDQGLIAQLGAASAEGRLSVQDLIVDLVRSASFLNRSTEELP